jgi:hypothetical protein
MRHLQPKVVVALVVRARCGIPALLDLFLKKFGCLQHRNNQKAPLGAPHQINPARCYLFRVLFVAEHSVYQAKRAASDAGAVL